jgi:hypothetical protein
MTNKPEVVVCGVPDWERPDIADVLRQMKRSGVTSVQIYTFWKDYEPVERGSFEWGFYDKKVRLIQEAGLKYVPFILIGPKYAAPGWWLRDPGHVGLKCMEHGKESPIDSIWNPLLRQEIDRVLKAFAEHYLPWDILESIQPGICGDYGESIMPVRGNWPGDYHTHRGYWMAGGDAAASFRSWLTGKYGTAGAVNNAWRSHIGAMREIRPFLPHKAPSRTALFDMLDWYKDSMTDFVDFWMAACRKHFPDTPIYMCTGGNEEPEHASLFSAQAKVCAKYNGGLRLTNEANRFFENFYLTSYTHSACEFYGAYLGLEPVGPMTAEGVTARMFGSAAYGNRQIFYYYNNIYNREAKPGEPIHDDRTRRFEQYLPLLGERRTECELAFFWPSYLGALQGEGIPEGMSGIVSHIRKTTNIMPVNDYMVADGALARYKLLIMPMEAFTRRDVLLKIKDWVLAGGKVFAVGGMRDLELESVPEYDALFGILPDSEQTIGGGAFKITTGDFPLIAELGEYRSLQGWLGLHPDTVLLSKADRVENNNGTVSNAGANLFMRSYPSGGAAIAFYGPTEFEFDAQYLWAQKPVFPLLMRDVIGKYTDSKELAAQPDEVVRAYIAGKLYALYDNGEISEK